MFNLLVRKIVMLSVAVLLMTACSKNDKSDTKKFDYKLQGTWISNDPSVYSGSLIIDYNKITILGYSEIQTPHDGDDTRRPFRNFTKGIPLSGYSEDDKIFIIDAGQLQESIPYIYNEENNGHNKILRLTFGDRIEVLMFENL
jgi:hypothetical protein